MRSTKELRPLSTRPPPRNSGFTKKEPLGERDPPAAELMAEFYRSVYDRSSESIFICGLDGAFMDANDTALAMLGVGLEELRGMTFQSIMRTDQLPALRSSLQEILLTGSHSQIHRFDLRTADGRDLVVAAKASLMLDDGDPSAIVCIARDVTEFFSLQEELRRAAALAAAGQVAGRAGHDIRNLLSPSVALIDYLLNMDPSDATPEKIATLKRIAASAQDAMERVDMLIKEMLVLSAPGMKIADDVDINPLLVVMAERLSATLRSDHYTVELDLASGMRKMRGDRVELDRALMNIISNAIDAMPDGGTLSIKSENVDDGAGSWVKVTLRDSGHGMGPDVLERIFEPHFSTKGAQGTGLGLAIVSKTLADHNGLIRVSSEPGSGTAFELFFPAI